MTIEEFETEVKSILQASNDKAISEKHFEINYESQYKQKFLHIIADNVLVFGEGDTWSEAFKEALDDLKEYKQSEA